MQRITDMVPLKRWGKPEEVADTVAFLVAPVSSLFAGLFTDEIAWLSSEDLEWIMGRGVCEWLGWKIP